MKFSTRPGKKKKVDVVLQATSKFKEDVTMDDVLLMASHFFENEERVYNSDKCEGAGMFMDKLIAEYNIKRQMFNKSKMIAVDDDGKCFVRRDNGKEIIATRKH